MSTGPATPPDVLRGQIITYLSHVEGHDATLSEICGALGEWTLRVASAIKPLVREGKVRLSYDDKGKKRYRYEARPRGDTPAVSPGVGNGSTNGAEGVSPELRTLLEAIQRRLMAIESILTIDDTIKGCPGSVTGVLECARDNQDRCHRCGRDMPDGQ